jgi:hypothetical protein
MMFETESHTADDSQATAQALSRKGRKWARNFLVHQYSRSLPCAGAAAQHQSLASAISVRMFSLQLL